MEPKNGEIKRVGIVFDDRMCEHNTPYEEPHPENPNRIRAIWKKLLLKSIPQRCVVLKAKEVDEKYVMSVHSKTHVKFVRSISTKEADSRRDKIASKFNSIYLNGGSSESAFLAAGSVVEVADKVAKGDLDSAFAIVRPPGHHAERNEPMGFCLFNNVAVATSFLLNERPELNIKKILIVDWDVHHGNGTQKMFWKDPRVLFFSVHRHEFGHFYPANNDGDFSNVGAGPGLGYNVNVPWEHAGCGDADYLAVWDHILLPIAKEFDPDMIFISAGFDAAVGDPLGGCCVTPYGYSVMLEKLKDFAQGKIVLALEGGYNLTSIANSVTACMEVLLGDVPSTVFPEAYPFESTWRTIEAVRQELSAFWPVLSDKLPTLLTSQIASPYKYLEIASSDSDNDDESSLELVDVNHVEVANVVDSLSRLKVGENDDQMAHPSRQWRSQLSKVDIWYACFGSNMWKPRFLCYITGGQVEGMKRPCAGSMDQNPPTEIAWMTFPHRLFFGHTSTKTWGPGGVAFLHPESNTNDKTYMCMYKITLEQFNDVLLQENCSQDHDTSSPLFDLNCLSSVTKEKSMSLDAIKGGWYHNVVYLGDDHGIPILTMTCSVSDVEHFKAGKLPLHAPCKGYANVLVRGLVESKQLSEDEAVAYIGQASNAQL